MYAMSGSRTNIVPYRYWITAASTLSLILKPSVHMIIVTYEVVSYLGGSFINVVTFIVFESWKVYFILKSTFFFWLSLSDRLNDESMASWHRTFSVVGANLGVDHLLPIGRESLDKQVSVNWVAKVTFWVDQWLIAVSLEVVCQPSHVTVARENSALTWTHLAPTRAKDKHVCKHGRKHCSLSSTLYGLMGRLDWANSGQCFSAWV